MIKTTKTGLDKNFEKYFFRKYGIKEMNPENRNDVLSRMESDAILKYKEPVDIKALAKEFEIGEKNFPSMWNLFTGNVSKPQLNILKCMNQYGDAEKYVSLDLIALCAHVSHNAFKKHIKPPVLEYMGVIIDTKTSYRASGTGDRERLEFRINREIMPQYYDKLLK